MMGPENAAEEPVTLARTMAVEPRIISLSERRSRVAEGSGAREQATSSADRTARFTAPGSALAIPFELFDLKRVTIPLPSLRVFVGHGVGTGCPKTPATAYVFIGGARRPSPRVSARISSVLMRVPAVPRRSSTASRPRPLSPGGRRALRMRARSPANSNSTFVCGRRPSRLRIFCGMVTCPLLLIRMVIPLQDKCSATMIWSAISGLAGAHDQHGYLQVVAHGVNGVAENQIFQATVAVSAHDDQVGLDLARVADDLLAGRWRVADGGFDGDALIAEGLRDAIQVLLAGLDLRGGRADGQAVERGVIERDEDALVNQGGGFGAGGFGKDDRRAPGEAAAAADVGFESHPQQQ